MTSVPDITRLLARIHEWQDGHGKPGGRAEAARRLEEAHNARGDRRYADPHAAGVAGQRSAAVMLPGKSGRHVISGIGNLPATGTGKGRGLPRPSGRPGSDHTHRRCGVRRFRRAIPASTFQF